MGGRGRRDEWKGWVEGVRALQLSESRRFLAPEHQVEVLDGGARGPLAEVVEDRGQQHVARWVGKGVQVDAVGVVAGPRVEAALVVAQGIRQRNHAHESLAPIALVECLPDRLASAARRQGARWQGNLDPHAAAKGAHGRHEVGRIAQAAEGRHLGDVLVHLVEGRKVLRRAGRAARPRAPPTSRSGAGLRPSSPRGHGPRPRRPRRGGRRR